MNAVEKAPLVREGETSPARQDWSWLLPWAFLAPALTIYVVVVVYPMAYSGYLSFFKWDGVAPTKQFVGLQNYFTLLFNDKVFWTALLNNAIWLVAALLIPTSIGLGLAVLLNKAFRGSSIYRSVFYFPAILSLAVVGLIWNWIYLPDIGLINQLLGGLGVQSLQHNWLSDPSFALYAVMAAAAWNAAGLPMLLFLAGLQTINPEILEAALVDGAGPVRRFFYITFPLLRETTLIVLAITAINSLKVYDIIYAMTYGGPANSTQVLSTWMYFLTYNYNSVGQGTAIAVILFLLTLIFAIPYIRMMGKE